MYSFLIPYFPKLTYQRHKRLVDFFKNGDRAWQADESDIVDAGWDAEAAREFVVWRRSFDVDKALANIDKEKIIPITIQNSAYPILLKEISDPPLVLFVRGTLPTNSAPTVAVVGTRRLTAYGKQVTEDLSRALARQGVTVVSGLALGVDGVAHEATLSEQGATVAVLGSGVDKKSVSPRLHHNLAERIIQSGGAIVSEYPVGFEPTTYSFPARNRIIAGLTLGVVVTEAPARSGALITAYAALGYNRDVFAVPHAITSEKGVGGNVLIKKGAKLVSSVNDIFEELRIEEARNTLSAKQILPENDTERRILAHLSKTPLHIDAIKKQTVLDSAVVSSALTVLEIKGLVKNIGGMNYIRM